jgi:hypothetical protein
MTVSAPKIVQIANAWALSDDDEGLDAADQLFALDDAGGVWRGNVGEDDNDGPFPAWYRLEAVPSSGQIVQIAIVSAPRDSRRDGVAMERLFALCNDGSVWLKILIIGREQAWGRLPDIPQHEIAQISVAWAPYQDSRGTLWAPLTDSTDRLLPAG